MRKGRLLLVAAVAVGAAALVKRDKVAGLIGARSSAPDWTPTPQPYTPAAAAPEPPAAPAPAHAAPERSLVEPALADEEIVSRDDLEPEPAAEARRSAMPEPAQEPAPPSSPEPQAAAVAEPEPSPQGPAEPAAQAPAEVAEEPAAEDSPAKTGRWSLFGRRDASEAQPPIEESEQASAGEASEADRIEEAQAPDEYATFVGKAITEPTTPSETVDTQATQEWSPPVEESDTTQETVERPASEGEPGTAEFMPIPDQGESGRTEEDSPTSDSDDEDGGGWQTWSGEAIRP